MLRQAFTISNPSGLHLRSASIFSTGAAGFSCDVTLRFKGCDYNAKSSIKVMTAGVKQGDEVEVITDGPDEEEAMEEIGRLVRAGLGE